MDKKELIKRGGVSAFSLLPFTLFQLSIWACPNELWVHYALSGVSLMVLGFVNIVIWMIVP